MLSLLARHKDTVLAKQQALSAEDGQMSGSVYNQHLVKLKAHQHQLKAIKSQERKIQLKRTFLPEYAAYIDGVLNANAGVQDDVFMHIMIWLVDTGDFSRAIALAHYAITHTLMMPARFNRTTEEFIIEDVSEAIMEAPDPVWLDDLNHLYTFVSENNLDMPDEVLCKLHKAIGLCSQSEPAFAIKHLDRALALNDRCGLKKLRNQLAKKLDSEVDDADVDESEPDPASEYSELETVASASTDDDAGAQGCEEPASSEDTSSTD